MDRDGNQDEYELGIATELPILLGGTPFMTHIQHDFKKKE